MNVKICGITDCKTAQFAIEAGADAIGFVFAESKRQISVSKAKEIIQTLPKHILKIGVFVNETKENLESIFEEVGLTHLQLHGDESPSFCQTLRYPVIKAIRIETELDINQIAEYPCDYILVDSPLGPYRGGNGTTFDWNLLNNKNIERKLILAGGLTIDNVLLASEIVKPVMVDVSSGVETDGKKDEKKIEAFINTVKRGGI
ncbi:phosphoribosylanthranilate isomerase [Gottfriedia solisilvae]|uniref:N-(5'-phosphoribosyl)anthranilate isomerase n=1 Tax=Gottfriedia solisilvae TaxID=1516104 RepID=A0A8J3ATP9_9BACI|nr:phosphoribosylanthranilate isomerase [Gottfriedia solisilvae]GGI16391.1 N-(5'-phosphoribosyl)anthranilate isomerase [Gottfriedia solisilvae]